MRFPAVLLALPLFVGYPGPATLTAQTPSTHPATSATSENTTASVRWNRLVPRFTDEAAASRRAARAAAKGDSVALRQLAMNPPPMAFQIYTVLSLAQYVAVNSARENAALSPEVAIASASATVLKELLKDPTVRASIDRELALEIQRIAKGSRAAERATASTRLGEDVARQVVGWAPTMNLVTPWNGTIPTGPGMWYSKPGVPPIGIGMKNARTWLLDSTSQFRPAPPPAYGSQTWLAAMEEVRHVARQRTPEHTRIARRWDSADPWTEWNETASAALRRNRASEAEAARVLAVLNVGASDAIIACFEAKYHYWTIRPSQTDTTLALADSVGLPNFPSYPSGHACSAGAFDAVLGHFFPQERAEFTRIAEEQAMSRLYGGVHYRFDNDVGLALGRVVARYAVDAERRGRLKSLPPGTAGKR